MAKRERIVVGINSGTSADGVDAVVCRIAGRGLRMRVEYLGMASRRYPSDLRERILAVMAPAATRTEEVGALHRDIGLAFARTAQAALKKLTIARADLIGSHGQTVGHYPAQGRGKRKQTPGWSLQLGDPALVAAAHNTPVVANFRQADMAGGGQGAPLVPWTDYVLFNDRKRARVLQNIGGIANLTYLPAGGAPEDAIAFDSGPGNMVMDALAQRLTHGRQTYDQGGRLAARGKVNETVLAAMLQHAYFKRQPPKSCGREEFGAAFVEAQLNTFARLKLTTEDWLATATALTAHSIERAYQRLGHIDEVILCGGGAKNTTLVRMLREQLAAQPRQTTGAKMKPLSRSQTRSVNPSAPELRRANQGAPALPGLGDTGPRAAAGAKVSVAPAPQGLGDKPTTMPRITRMDEYGIPSQAKECISFAMLAAARMDSVPANLPQVTGAQKAVLLGGVFA